MVHIMSTYVPSLKDNNKKRKGEERKKKKLRKMEGVNLLRIKSSKDTLWGVGWDYETGLDGTSNGAGRSAIRFFPPLLSYLGERGGEEGLKL